MDAKEIEVLAAVIAICLAGFITFVLWAVVG
jgi:hypothetical protein